MAQRSHHCRDGANLPSVADHVCLGGRYLNTASARDSERHLSVVLEQYQNSMQRPRTQAELEHEQQRQRERIARQPSVLTVTVAVVGVATVLYATFGILAVVVVASVGAAGVYAVL